MATTNKDFRVKNGLVVEQDVTVGGDITFSGTITGDGSGLTGITSYTSTDFANDLATKTTSDLTEGTNLYYTDARARTSISVTDAGGDGSVAYNSSTGEITYTGPSATEVRAHFTAGDNVDITDGVISVTPSTTLTDLTVDSIQFNTSAGVTVGTGEIAWNATDSTFDVGMTNGTVLQLGQEQYFYAKAVGAISNGQVVMFAGAQGSHVLVSPADTSSVGFEDRYIVGIATHSIANGEFGYITTFGKVRGLDTSVWVEGTILYIDPALPGGLTATKPVAPHHATAIAAVTRQHAVNGELMVRVEFGKHLDELHDVHFATSPTNNQFIRYNSANSRWENTTVTTSTIGEGTNLYYTDGRFDTRLSTKSTDDLTEGTNLYYTDARVATKLAAGVGNIVTTGELRGPASFVIDPAAVGDNTGVVIIKGDLQVDGTTTTINSTTLSVDDKNIVLASGAADGATADGAGITIDGAGATLTYASTGDLFTSNKSLRITDGTNTLQMGQWDASTNRIESVNRGLFLTTYSGAIQLGYSGNADLTISNTRKVGIGNPDPKSVLHVSNGSGAGSSGILNLTPNGSGGGAGLIVAGNNDSGGTAGPNVIAFANRTIGFGAGDNFASSSGGTATYWANLSSTGLSIGDGFNTATAKLAVFGGASDNQSSDATFLVSSYTSNDWGQIIDKGSSSDYGLDIRVAPSAAYGFRVNSNFRVNGSGESFSTNSYVSGNVIVRGYDTAPRGLYIQEWDGATQYGGGISYDSVADQLYVFTRSGSDTDIKALKISRGSNNVTVVGAMSVGDSGIASGKFNVYAGGASGVSWGSGFNIGDSSNYYGIIQDSGTARHRNFGNGNFDWFNQNGSQIMTLNANGNLGVAGTITESSSRRLKENIRPITNALEVVNKLQGVIYDKIDGSQKDEPGLIAEDTLDAIANLVVFDDDGQPSGVKYTKTVAYLIEAVKELTAKVNALENK